MTAEFRIKPQEAATTSTSSGELTCRNCKSRLSRIKRSGLAKFFLFGLPLKNTSVINVPVKPTGGFLNNI